MNLQSSEPQTLILHPGDVACVERGVRMETLLGSCVAILLTDPRRTLGAMCHIVHVGLPRTNGSLPQTAFGNAALLEMARLLRRRDIDFLQCEAWVYGGGNMFHKRAGDIFSQEKHVGASNAQWALNTLRRAGIPVRNTSLGGRAYRKLRWTVGHEDPIVETAFVPLIGTA